MFSLFRKRTIAPALAPPPGAVTREMSGPGWHILLDLAPQVVSLAVPWQEFTLQPGEEALAPTCATRYDGFISASLLAVKAKVFDDSVYAAVELALQNRKQALLAPLVHAAPLIAAAARLGGMEAPTPPEARHIAEHFLADELKSKPLAFYTWSEALGRIFRQDRLLQEELGPADAARVMVALEGSPVSREWYANYLDFVARLTNPLTHDQPDLRQPDGRYFFPPSRSHESELVTRLYGRNPIPDGFSLGDEMLKRVRDGSLKLEPTDTSGWYDYQTWALEPLARPQQMPESARLRMNAEYRAQLGELFKAILSLTRETHVKQLEVPMEGCALYGGEKRPLVRITPELTVEPIPSYFERRAESYRFLQRVLEFAGPLTSMHRLTAAGPVKRPLAAELPEMTALFDGAAAVSRGELGMEVATGADAAWFREWVGTADVREDIRMMVPIFYDVGRGRTKVWAILGWASRQVEVSFVTRPAVHVVNGRPEVIFDSTSRPIAYPVFAEAYVTRLLNREEFRRHCDRYRTRTRILENLA